MIRVVVAEDQWAVRAGLVMILDSAPDITVVAEAADGEEAIVATRETQPEDRKSTRLNSSHVSNSYAVFCLKKNNHDPRWKDSTRGDRQGGRHRRHGRID